MVIKNKLKTIVVDGQIVGIECYELTNTNTKLVFEKIGIGQFNCISDGLFITGKTQPYIQLNDGAADAVNGLFLTKNIDENTILIYSENIVTADYADVDFRDLDFNIEIFEEPTYTDEELSTILFAQSVLVKKGLRSEASKIGAPRPRG